MGLTLLAGGVTPLAFYADRLEFPYL